MTIQKPKRTWQKKKDYMRKKTIRGLRRKGKRILQSFDDGTDDKKYYLYDTPERLHDSNAIIEYPEAKDGPVITLQGSYPSIQEYYLGKKWRGGASPFGTIQYMQDFLTDRDFARFANATRAYGNGEGISGFWNGLTDNPDYTGAIEDPGTAFLMKPARQAVFLNKLGYIEDARPIGRNMIKGPYEALYNYTGKYIPTYRKGWDDEQPENVESISDTDVPEDVSKQKSPEDSAERSLVHAGYYPTGYFKSKEGDKYYQMDIDLNDYGQHEASDAGGAKSAYKQDARSTIANLYDYFGNPFVQRSGLRKLAGKPSHDNGKDYFDIGTDDGSQMIYQDGDQYFAGPNINTATTKVTPYVRRLPNDKSTWDFIDDKGKLYTTKYSDDQLKELYRQQSPYSEIYTWTDKSGKGHQTTNMIPLSPVDPVGEMVVETAAGYPLFKGASWAGKQLVNDFVKDFGYTRLGNWAKNKILSDALNKNVKAWDGTVGPEYFKSSYKASITPRRNGQIYEMQTGDDFDSFIIDEDGIVQATMDRDKAINEANAILYGIAPKHTKYINYTTEKIPKAVSDNFKKTIYPRLSTIQKIRYNLGRLYNRPDIYVVDDKAFALTDLSENVLGFHIPGNKHIRMRKPNINTQNYYDAVVDHEHHHYIDDTLGQTQKQKKLYQKAYGYRGLGTDKTEMEQYMTDFPVIERPSVNSDIRNMILTKSERTLPLEEQNKIIQNISADKILDVLDFSAYSHALKEKLMSLMTNGNLQEFQKRINDIKNALMYAPATVPFMLDFNQGAYNKNKTNFNMGTDDNEIPKRFWETEEEYQERLKHTDIEKYKLQRVEQKQRIAQMEKDRAVFLTTPEGQKRAKKIRDKDNAFTKNIKHSIKINQPNKIAKITDSIVDSLKNVSNIRNDIQEAVDNQEQDRKEHAREVKNVIDATMTVGELGFSGLSLLRAFGNYRNWKNGTKLAKRVINLLNKNQLPMQVGGTLIDGYQIYDNFHNGDYKNGIYNTASVIGGIGGSIGASDIFRSSQMYNPKIDKYFDITGIMQNIGDYLKFGYDVYNKNDKNNR